MTIIVNEVRRGTYHDSVALMRIGREIAGLAGIEEAGLMMATPANRAILAEARVLGPEGEVAGPGDLVIAVRARDREAAEAALARARGLLDARRAGAGIAGSGSGTWQPRTLRSGLETLPDANLALISVPGEFAAAEARKALHRGLNVMIFSDNVPLADEIALKREASAAGLLVMGPDCGTAIIAGLPLAFANRVPRGDVGIIGASGTGIQEVSCLIARAGRGISHAIGTGGRDLKAEVGGLTTLAALDLLDADPATRHIVLISKPPADEVAREVLQRVARSAKTFTICFLGATDLAVPANARSAATLEDAAVAATGVGASTEPPRQSQPVPHPANGGRHVAGLFSGGTLCAEAQIVGLQLGERIASNAPVPGASEAGAAASGAHVLLDLGDDAFTRGRPHPMIEPAVRDEPIRRALADPDVGVVLLDVVLGNGSHRDPAGHIARLLAGQRTPGPLVVTSVTGTHDDRQGLAGQIAMLEAAGVIVAPSNAAAARLAFAAVALVGAGSGHR